MQFADSNEGRPVKSAVPSAGPARGLRERHRMLGARDPLGEDLPRYLPPDIPGARQVGIGTLLSGGMADHQDSVAVPPSPVTCFGTPLAAQLRGRFAVPAVLVTTGLIAHVLTLTQSVGTSRVGV